MADFLPDPPAFTAGTWRRDWHDYDQYRVAHENNMQALENEGLVIADTLSFREIMLRGRVYEVNLRGRVTTFHGATVTVNKWLAVTDRRGRLAVMTREYDYHARADGPGLGQDLFRYDNCDGGTDTLHRHYFDAAGSEILPKQPIEVDRLPPLNLIIREADFYANWLLSRLQP